MKSFRPSLLVVGLSACFLAGTAMAGGSHIAGISARSADQSTTPQRFNVAITNRHGAPLLIANISVTGADTRHAGSWEQHTYLRTCTRGHGVTRVAVGTFRVGIRFSLRRDPQRPDTFVATVQRATLTDMQTSVYAGCTIGLPALAQRTASFVVTARGGHGMMAGPHGFQAVITRA